ncbi:dipeptidase PepE [Thalassotalea sp. PS06]|uniref:dipeptidase PepE n=1 Tax=Thalassotalea sp. PS06 TaxID=2594005 RepID=UPI001164FB13|nr:dipeptidase PepE [Thalassotalea sp. PS06]QDP01316.1 dipeptidase PepE [Thalassotalea sp. PS06]
MNSNLLLLSSSRVGNSKYLEHAQQWIAEHLGNIKELLFIPYAGVSISYDEYTSMVQTALSSIGVKVTGIHESDDPVNAVNNAKAIAIGGGNTFHLLHQLYENNLLAIVRDKTEQGMPYIGWSAGSNVAGISIRTTNDMPIIEPPSFEALGLLPFQINPHYTNYLPPGHNGETREQRLQEFMVVDPQTSVLAIVEGTALKLTGTQLKLIGSEDGWHFKGGDKSAIVAGQEIDFL